MDFYKVIENRTSNKSYKSTPIPKEKLDNIINAALIAPSWKNKTCYRFIFINERKLIDQISNTIINKTDKTANAVKQAPIIAVIVANPSESGEDDNKSYFMLDCGIAMEHLILAATNEGYGTCWIGSFDEETVSKVLNIPENFKVVAMTPIGETDENDEHYPPKDISKHIYYNSWENSNRQ
ncbi:nitroreductase family protein [Clostridium algidicarnis]|uniref:nitroreductase family protein n=1 Tax=Clostridium algidicarnis TaxID=37659 RepID=UPI001C0B48CC|nr:nitroreductase family protein [Clostridium algidicarnis]MBU3202768.1 nitroreductase family protein [Clostridium algidicarnis]MBU3210922.1 nitroreductase family protein [Clostridium algidicarnis]MBU3222570.1 nitroreductase family protein [Clostridium algidicarnis]